jgi:hypothetical protein
MKKQVTAYLFAICLLGTFQGLMMSFGSHIGYAILVSVIFWAGMLAPMLSSGK